MEQLDSVLRQITNQDLVDPARCQHGLDFLLDAAGGPDALLDKFIREDRLLGSVATAYEHPTGFSKIVLAGGPKPRPELRLHIWRHGTTSEDEIHIHNHPWNFASFVISGEFQTRLYRPNTARSDYILHKVAPPAAGGEGYLFVEDQKIGLDLMFDVKHACHSIYAIDYRAIHSAHTRPGEMAATLMLQGSFVREVTDVYSRTRICSGPRDITPLSPGMIRDRLKLLRSTP